MVLMMFLPCLLRTNSIGEGRLVKSNRWINKGKQVKERSKVDVKCTEPQFSDWMFLINTLPVIQEL
jgi:hypothetical protein